MKLVKVDSGVVGAEPERFNSSFHTEAEAPILLPPTEIPYSFERWLPLISRTQNIPSSSIQVITLSRSQGNLLLKASQSSLIRRETSRMYAEDLDDEIKPTLSSLIFPPGGLFLRFAACSPKDGVGGTTPLRTVNDILLRIATSFRATNSIRNILDTDATGIKLLFLPHNSRMETAREYRVFCPPPSGLIAALSQYKWHQPSKFHDRDPDDIEKTIQTIMMGTRRIHTEILKELGNPGACKVAELVLQQGFTFDISFDEETGRSYLVELNAFGTRSGCGSCLFHWLTDNAQLYGREQDVEFRISI
ncbi:uncharacterized protein BP5553_01681 [Venustampulla echinocandica]|uniref:Cell division cycle protein 123 n=1 Tax=Venustampulla echinocandica TaxID=2656787 RepID=A0A370U1P2_9HELO|nr:uncharacterized protein BP5553_01681 [Venustampulla echinocandica]RDL41702.1 hypothetical protein BP5553_01681 [Venustampulla echinocandica]